MRLSLRSAALFTLLSFAFAARASGNESIPTPETLARLELRASQANPREQCFLYAELIHDLTAQAAAQLAAADASQSDTAQAAATLRQIDRFVPLIQRNLTHNPKRLKDAEILLHSTTYLFSQLLHHVSDEDRAALHLTLAHLTQLNEELLTEVFNH
jgi:hypothetical protein